MLRENVVRKNVEQPVGIFVSGPGAPGWETWVSEAGFELSGEEEADLILWVDPEPKDFPSIAGDRRSIVVGDAESKALCRQKQIPYVKDEENGEGVQRQLEDFARETRERKESAPPARGHGLTVPPALSAKPAAAEKKHRITLQRGLKKRQPPASEPVEEFEAEETLLSEQRKDIVLALPPMADSGNRFIRYIYEKSNGEYRVLEVAETFAKLLKIVDKGFFEVLLVHRNLPGLEQNFVENLKLLRDKAPGSRLILIEREADEYSAVYRNHLQAQDIEWQVIPKMPGHLMDILRRATGGDNSSSIVFEWDEENTAVSSLPVPAVRTKVLSPVLLAAHSAGGGVGKSTESTQLGFTFAEMGYKTLIIELDAEKPSLLRAVGAPEDCPGLVAWDQADFKNEETALEAIHRTSRQVHGLYVLPVGPISPKKAVLPFHLEVKDGDACSQAEVLFRAALREFQIVIVDTNTNLLDPPVYTAMKMAKRIFYIMEATRVFLDSAEAHLEQAYALGIELSHYRIVLNKCTSRDPVNLRVISQALEMPVSMQVPLDVEGYRLAAHHGRAYKPKKGTTPWKEFCETILRDVEVPVNIGSAEKKTSLRSLLFGWRKKK